MSLVYYKEIFDKKDIQDAKKIILTHEATGGDSETRWSRETGYTAQMIQQAIPDLKDKMVLDFGCGIGRMSKALIDAYGCYGLGVDISREMRHNALEYLPSDRFGILSYDVFSQLAEANALHTDYAICIYSLQHCFNIEKDIANIAKVVTKGLFIINTTTRKVPAIDDSNNELIFADDGKDVKELLRSQFSKFREIDLDPEIISRAEIHWCGYFSH